MQREGGVSGTGVLPSGVAVAKSVDGRSITHPGKRGQEISSLHSMNLTWNDLNSLCVVWWES